MDDRLALWMPHLTGFGFAFALGACVGSFINVVAYRMPLGMSVINPPSRCPTCGRRLRLHENIPILGWAFARGRCSTCRVSISLQYPGIELLVALMFAATYWMSFVAEPSGWWGRSWAQWFQHYGLVATLPGLVAVLTLLSCLVASTLTDVRTFTIPLGVTLTATVTGVAAWALQGALATEVMAATWPLPSVSWWVAGASLGGGVAVLGANALLHTGSLTRSFADYGEFVKDGETLAEYPHARREMEHEVILLGGIIVAALVGALSLGGVQGIPPPVMQGLCAPVFGYMIGAGTVWVVRIVATWIKGVEAMGMGDVHLLGAAGACLGWIDPLAAFFIAPFSGLAWVGAAGVVKLASGKPLRRELPYGPHLAVAVVALVLCRGAFVDVGRLVFPGVIPAVRALQTPPRSGEMGALSERPEGQHTSEKGFSNEEDMDRRWMRSRRNTLDGLRQWGTEAKRDTPERERNAQDATRAGAGRSRSG